LAKEREDYRLHNNKYISLVFFCCLDARLERDIVSRFEKKSIILIKKDAKKL